MNRLIGAMAIVGIAAVVFGWVLGAIDDYNRLKKREAEERARRNMLNRSKRRF